MFLFSLVSLFFVILSNYYFFAIIFVFRNFQPHSRPFHRAELSTTNIILLISADSVAYIGSGCMMSEDARSNANLLPSSGSISRKRRVSGFQWGDWPPGPTPPGHFSPLHASNPAGQFMDGSAAQAFPCRWQRRKRAAHFRQCFHRSAIRSAFIGVLGICVPVHRFPGGWLGHCPQAGERGQRLGKGEAGLPARGHRARLPASRPVTGPWPVL